MKNIVKVGNHFEELSFFGEFDELNKAKAELRNQITKGYAKCGIVRDANGDIKDMMFVAR